MKPSLAKIGSAALFTAAGVNPATAEVYDLFEKWPGTSLSSPYRFESNGMLIPKISDTQYGEPLGPTARRLSDTIELVPSFYAPLDVVFTNPSASQLRVTGSLWERVKTDIHIVFLKINGIPAYSTSFRSLIPRQNDH